MQMPRLTNRRTSRRFHRNLVATAIFLVLAALVFAVAPKQISPYLDLKLLCVSAFGGLALLSVARALLFGNVRPFIGNFPDKFSRASQPKRFWSSTSLNFAFGSFFLFLAYSMVGDAAFSAIEDQCYNSKQSYQPQKSLSACNDLIGMRGIRDEETGNLIAARGNAYLLLGDYKNATLDYTEAVRIDPNDASSYYNLGLIDENFEDLGLAVDDFSAAIRSDPDNTDAYFHRGMNFRLLGKFREAMADFTKAHALQPTNVEPIVNRAFLYAYLGDQRLADRDLAIARVIAPSDPRILQGEAFLAMHAGNYASALRPLTQILHRDPKNIWALATRAEAYERIGKDKEARKDKKMLAHLTQGCRANGTHNARLCRHP